MLIKRKTKICKFSKKQTVVLILRCLVKYLEYSKYALSLSLFATISAIQLHQKGLVFVRRSVFAVELDCLLV